MATSGKIRVWLLILGATLFFTAIIVQKTYSPLNNLDETASALESNLQKKEAYINQVLNNSANFNQLKSLSTNPKLAFKYIQDFTNTNNIWFITLNGTHLGFWSGTKVIPEFPAAIKEGYSFRQEPNGFYETIRKSEGDFSAIFFIPVKQAYNLENHYLENTFASDLVSNNNIEIADYIDKNVREIHSGNGQYLFSVKLQPGEIDHVYFYSEITCWILTMLCFCILMHSICDYMVSKGFVFLALLALSIFIVLVRFINLNYGWPDLTYRLQIFDPSIYGASFAFASLGDFCINIFFACWFVVFLYIQRHRLLTYNPSKIAGYIIFIGGILALIIISTILLNLFYGLVINSKISFDVSNVLHLSPFSLLGILMLCFSFLIFYLFNEVFLTISVKLDIADRSKLLLFFAAIVATTLISAWYDEFTLFYLLWAILVVTRAYAYKYNNGALDSVSFSLIILTCAVISSIKLSNFQSVKENDIRKHFIQKLESTDDNNADEIFKRIETKIITDSAIIQYFNNSNHNNNFVKTRLQKLYFNGYLSNYEFNVREYDSHQQPISADKNYALSVFTDLVLYSSFKASTYFYRENESFGFFKYFAILPITQNGKSLGTVVIELKSKPSQTYESFPGLLIDGNINTEDEYKGYSYAFYTDDKLLSQNGSYVYNVINTDLKGQLKKYVYTTSVRDGGNWYQVFKHYSHIIYKPSNRNLIVVSKEENPVFFAITSVTFFFVIFLIFGLTVILFKWLRLRIKIFYVKDSRIKWDFKINFGRILYKTRIQFSMIFAVVATLILVGFITFYSISTEYQTQQDRDMREKITQIAAAFEAGPYDKYLANINEESQVDFNDFANKYSTDLTLFALNGSMLLSTEPKIYEYGLHAGWMNASAFIALSKEKKSEYVNNEVIGKLSYYAAYVPLNNSDHETIAYLQLPYFSNETDYKERIGSLLNIMFNVYALVFIAIGFFAVFIARQITAPLSFIQHSLSKTMYGKKNEPIRWDRDDEIGKLVEEYNNMISALENSAQRLAQSERESAWREMAKQVAHEIKNPLTPLKLGLQLLDKSWKDKDPKFDQKFERFSKSFVEQIESLSSIASEFSAFARMPDTRMEQLNVFEILNQAVIIFKQMDNIRISYNPPETPFYIYADRDQLLRCFNNLLKNAIEAIPEGRPGTIEINHLVTSKNILLTLKDNGNGIPENLRDKIFEPNFTTKSSGTGLGLAFVKNSVGNAGGKVWFETVLGEGTTFYLSLPAA